jgi:hypothetical protein
LDINSSFCFCKKTAANVDLMALLVTFDDVTDGAGACPGVRRKEKGERRK